MKNVPLLYGKTGCSVRVPDSAVELTGQDPPALLNPEQTVRDALAAPLGCKPLADQLAAKKPQSVAITISDITRPVPNKVFLPPLLAALNENGVADSQITIIVGTGMHRPSTAKEHEILVGADILARVKVIDHTAEKPETLVRVTEGDAEHPPVSINRQFAEADFRIVTGYIEPHFMAGFSGGRKGVCPALVDLATIQRFHGYRTLSSPLAANGVIENNPCHVESLRVARAVGVDLLLNVAITGARDVAGVYCGDLEAAHAAGCKQVAQWTSAEIDGPFDLVVTNAGGYPLDETFYQAVKGQVTALPALGEQSTLLQIAACGEALGSSAYTELMRTWGRNWQGFLEHIAASDVTALDQWELQMQCRVLERIGIERLRLVTDGVDPDVQQTIAVNPVLGEGDAPQRLQRAVDAYLEQNPDARVAVIPHGPYTMIRSRQNAPTESP